MQRRTATRRAEVRADVGWRLRSAGLEQQRPRETDSELAVLAEVSTGEQALDVTRRLRPGVVLMDIRMPEMDGLEATRRIVKLSPAPRVLILTTFDLDEYVFDALQAGASGFVLKDVAPESLIAAVHTGSPPAKRCWRRRSHAG